jgi:site-specific recombinase XerD
MSNLRERMLHDMQLHGYANRTQEVYLWSVKKLQQHFQLSPDQISEDQLRDYFIYRKNVSKWAPGTMRIAYAGIKFFYTFTLKRDWTILKLIRAKNEKKLPTVLSIHEVRSILEAIKSPPSKACLTLIYSCGLRLNEALTLQVSDVDGQRKLIHIRLGKGAKDRYVPLPDSTLDVLRDYYKTHRNQKYLFPTAGQSGKKRPTSMICMAPRTVQGALKATTKDLPTITKKVTPHTFRHSYATHLLEAGVSIRLVQEYLGHSSLASTMIYVHITKVGQEDACRKINRLIKGVVK